MKIKSKFNNKFYDNRYMLTFRNIKELLNYNSSKNKDYLVKLSNIIKSHKIIKNISIKNGRS